tara:strand:- start:150 stop:644 length:495 start_codon:yes stop_codon:yes gene_type:complete
MDTRKDSIYITLAIAKSDALSEIRKEFEKSLQQVPEASGIDGKLIGDWFIAWPKGRSIFWSSIRESPGFYIGNIVEVGGQAYIRGKLFASFAKVYRSALALILIPVLQFQSLHRLPRYTDGFAIFQLAMVLLLVMGIYRLLYEKCPVESKKQIYQTFQKIFPLR